MIAKLVELITGKDDLERVAARDDMDLLEAYLKTRPILIPRLPGRFLDAVTFTQEELLELIREEAEALAGDPFEPWILDVDGKRRLPAFSSQKKMTVFSGKVSQRMGKVFSLGCAEVLLWNVVEDIHIDFVDLNPLSAKSWEIGIGLRSRRT